MTNISLLKLFYIFVKIGAILLGGGYVILPILTSEFVEKKELISHEDLINYFTISQSLPGIMAANISIMIGYKLKGKIGAIFAMLGIIFVPFWSIILLASFLDNITSNLYVQKAFEGINIAIIALIILTIREIAQKIQEKNLFFYLIFSTTLIILLLTNCSPIYLILILTPLGILYKHIEKKKVIK